MRNVIVLGVGHSGTTILTKMLHSLGWNISHDNDPEYFEPVTFREANKFILKNKTLPENVDSLLGAIPSPWAIKDPRLTTTLSHWIAAFKKYDPLLLWIQRDIEEVVKSYERRGELDANGLFAETEATVQGMFRRAEKGFTEWSGHKMIVRYEDIQAAISLWSPSEKVQDASAQPSSSKREPLVQSGMPQSPT